MRAGAWIALLSLAALVAVVAGLHYPSLADYATLLRARAAAVRRPHASIEVVAFGEDGRRLRSLGFLRIWQPTLIVRDHTGAVCFGLQYGLGMPRLAVPPAEPVSFELLWPVSGFGKVLLSADNGGRGYRVSAGAYTRLELLPELARSRVAAVEDWIAQHNHGHPASDEVADALALARRQLEQMAVNTDPRQRASLAAPALRLALRAGEQEVLAEAVGAIPDRRRGTLLIKVIDPRGAPVPNVRIHVTEARPDFLFGVGISANRYNADALARLKQLGVNYATLDLNWRLLEPRPDFYAFEQFERIASPLALQRDGLVLRARLPTWSFDPAIPSFAVRPPAGPALSSAELQRHLAPVVRRYQDQIDVWEVAEDPAAWVGFGAGRADTAAMIKAAAEEIRKDAPKAKIAIAVAAPLGERVAAQYHPTWSDLIHPGAGGGPALDPYSRLEALTRAGVPYDIVGLQLYYGGLIEDADSSDDPPAIDLFRLARELERWGKLGKPLQVSDIAVGSACRGGQHSWWHACPDEATQAEYLADALTVAYGNPQVRAMHWSALNDAYAAVAGGGLLDPSGRPKLAFDRLATMLTGWRSDGDLTSGADGAASFQGSAGDYELSAHAGDASVSGHAHIHREATEVALMSIDVPPAPAPPIAPPASVENGETPAVPDVAPPAPDVEVVPSAPDVPPPDSDVAAPDLDVAPPDPE